jgi:hypothetical protein
MRKQTILGAFAALLLAVGCGSSDIGDILGGSGPSSSISELRGKVDSVDLNSRSIVLTNVSTYSSGLQSGGLGSGETARVYFDDRTTVTYQGRSYRPENLERGDEVAVQVDRSGDRLFATAMTVLYDSSGTTAGSTSGTVQGTVRYVDTGRRTIELDRSGQILTLQYDTNTYVDHNGRRFRPEDLERGDEITVHIRDLGTGRYLAEGINVVRSASDQTYGGTTSSALRGTVRGIDANRRLIELEQTSWVPRFTTGSGSSVVVEYDANTTVEFQGRMYAPTNLERGDVVDVAVRDLGNRLLAERIIVVRDVGALR